MLGGTLAMMSGFLLKRGRSSFQRRRMNLDWKMSLKTPKMLRKPKMKTLSQVTNQVHFLERTRLCVTIGATGP